MKVYGPIIERRIWRITSNKELRELYKTPDPVSDIKRRLEWLGHMIRRDLS